jgi:hypothetical protein
MNSFTERHRRPFAGASKAAWRTAWALRASCRFADLGQQVISDFARLL